MFQTPPIPSIHPSKPPSVKEQDKHTFLPCVSRWGLSVWCWSGGAELLQMSSLRACHRERSPAHQYYWWYYLLLALPFPSAGSLERGVCVFLHVCTCFRGGGVGLLCVCVRESFQRLHWLLFFPDHQFPFSSSSSSSSSSSVPTNDVMAEACWKCRGQAPEGQVARSQLTCRPGNPTQVNPTPSPR